MHEFSIVQSLLELIERNVEQNGGKYVTKAVVKIGKMSGVEPHLLKIAFDTFKEGTVCENAELEMIIQDVIARCNSCGKEILIDNYSFVCPVCEGTDLKIIDGEDMYLISLEIEV
ncbi:hydrogenase maturation nickel metallochaperone HypA [Persephonella sp.]